MKILDTPCEYESTCSAPVELLHKKLSRETHEWLGFYMCLNKHYYIKKMNVRIADEYSEWPEPDNEDYIQDQLPFNDGDL